CQQRESHPWTF
nr:immunoglobulin light chain junction region [Macaca mulatta]MOW11854.1 immunoglobulin light chain junction region [Macaca mulatta]MOW13817.1 immunoglobulin light chain junction region [Macaca mulatta]